MQKVKITESGSICVTCKHSVELRGPAPYIYCESDHLKPSMELYCKVTPNPDRPKPVKVQDWVRGEEWEEYRRPSELLGYSVLGGNDTAYEICSNINKDGRCKKWEGGNDV
jgi:hypothetical protein